MILLLFFITGLIALTPPALAQDIKARMKARLPTIIALKARGVVGENNRGYLQFIGAKTAEANVVDAENSDRRKVYELIAKQQKTSADVVGRHRSRTLHANARKGEWIQTADGKWHQK
jgi:uncharacterized protein YdbL (DUF1318 family)